MNKHDPYQEAYILSRRANARSYAIAGALYSDGAWETFRKLRLIIAHFRKADDSQLHPAVIAALKEFERPADMHLLALEWAQVASDGVRVAYVRNEAKREAHYEDSTGNKHLTATTVGKYLKRHWPNVPDTAIRNLAACFMSRYEWVTTMEGMVEAVQKNSSESCMQWSESAVARAGGHPYEVYNPKYGWKMAVVKDGNNANVGRALVLDDGDRKVFVRTYGKEDSSGNTQSHEGLEGWLEQQGYEYEDEWPEGCKFAKIRRKDGRGWLAPYLDPGSTRIASSWSRRVTDGGDYFYRDDNGEYTWDNTDGTTDEEEDDSVTCDDCGDRVDPDDTSSVGYHGDTCVCSSCLENYTYVTGRRGHQYYIPENDAVTTLEGEDYDPEYTSDNNIVELQNGEYTHEDNAVYLDGEQEYWHVDDIAGNPQESGDVVRIESSGEYVLRSNAEWCKYSEEWIEEDDAVKVKEGYVHLDNLDDFLASLSREEVAENCTESELEEKLRMWDEENGVYDTQVSLPLEVNYAQQVQNEVAQAPV